MLETIREFGLEQLEASRESDTVKQSHAQLFLQLAEEAEANLLGKEQKAWLERLEEEHDNLRAALNWMDEVDAVEMSLRMVGALWRFWLMRVIFTEGRARVTRVLEADGTNALPAARAKGVERPRKR
jgi:non-specific serine/threonine protein kinase